jgi:hypothetical protein
MRWYEALAAVVVSVVLIYGLKIVGMAQRPRSSWPELFAIWREYRGQKERR